MRSPAGAGQIGHLDQASEHEAAGDRDLKDPGLTDMTFTGAAVHGPDG
jgi:hypothetical protein